MTTYAPPHITTLDAELLPDPDPAGLPPEPKPFPPPVAGEVGPGSGGVVDSGAPAITAIAYAFFTALGHTENHVKRLKD